MRMFFDMHHYTKYAKTKELILRLLNNIEHDLSPFMEMSSQEMLENLVETSIKLIVDKSSSSIVSKTVGLMKKLHQIVSELTITNKDNFDMNFVIRYLSYIKSGKAIRLDED